MPPIGKLLALSCVVLGSRVAVAQNQVAPLPRSSSSRVDVRYVLFSTENIWTTLLLDSSTGRLWQVQYALSDSTFAGRLPIINVALVDSSRAHAGRFTLFPTHNIFTFLLLDQDNGTVYQIQWSNDAEKRGLVRALSTIVMP